MDIGFAGFHSVMSSGKMTIQPSLFRLINAYHPQRSIGLYWDAMKVYRNMAGVLLEEYILTFTTEGPRSSYAYFCGYDTYPCSRY